MKQPRTKYSDPSQSDRTRLTRLLVLIGVGLLLLIPLVAALLGGKLQPQANLSPASTAPTSDIPAADCASPSLVIGTSTLQMQVIQLEPDGSVNVPPDGSGIAYWVEGTDLQYIFMLSPTPENLLLLTSLSAGTTAIATWSNCTSMTFTLFDPRPGDFETTYLPDQSTASIAIYVQLDPTGEGFMVDGEVRP